MSVFDMQRCATLNLFESKTAHACSMCRAGRTASDLIGGDPVWSRWMMRVVTAPMKSWTMVGTVG